MHRSVAAVAACCSFIVAGCSQAASPPIGTTQRAAVHKDIEYRILSNFSGEFDGSHPVGSLAPWLGLLYGTTVDGGKYNHGTVFRVSPDGKSTYPLHSFDGGKEGCAPMAGVTFATANVYYGTASSCGDATEGGTIYSGYTPSRLIKVLHSFNVATDGGNPEGRLLLIGSTLYGTTRNGGAHGKGTLYSVDTKTEAFSVLYAFGTQGDAATPVAGVIEVGGKLFGTSYDGGSEGAGTIYQFDPANGAEKIVYSFDRTGGARPTAALLSWNGAFYGVTPSGGVSSAGTIFKFDLTSGDETVLYNFGSGDAIAPDGALIVYKDVLYGTTRRGGSTGKDFGTIFRYTPAKKSFEELHAFSGKPDGARPRAGLTFSRADKLDQLFGTTYGGGANDLGTAFKIVP